MSAEYRVGRSGLFLPSDLRADADTLAAQVSALDDALSAHGGQVSENGKAFLRWENEWNAFYANTFGSLLSDFTAALNNGNRDQLVQHELRFEALANALESEGIGITDRVGQRAPGGGALEGLGGAFGGLTDSLNAAVLLLLVFAFVWKVIL